MSNTEKRIYFNGALCEVKNEMLRLQVRIDEYARAREARRSNSIDTPRERGAIKRASLDLSAALVKLRRARI